MPIDSVHAHVVLPDGVMPTRTAVYTGARGSVATDAKIEKQGNEVDFTLLRGLYAYEGMTIGVGWPAGHISSRPSQTRVLLAQVLQWSPLLLPLFVFILAFKAWEKKGRDPKEGSYVVRYEPVEGASPAELGTLVDNRADMDDITATLVDLAVRGFVRIEEVTESHLLGLSKSTDYIIRILRDPSQWTGLKPHEELYLSKLSELAPIGESEVKVSELRNKFYGALPKIRDAIYDSLVTKGYYLERPDAVQGKWFGLAAVTAFIGIGLGALATKRMWVAVSPFALIAAGILSTVILLVFAALMPARTIAGARAREATLGFKEFLGRVESERYKAMITSPEMFERFLPYAMAFGVADKWARAFENIYREPPTWYTGGSGQFSAINFASSISDMSSATASSMSSSPARRGQAVEDRAAAEVVEAVGAGSNMEAIATGLFNIKFRLVGQNQRLLGELENSFLRAKAQLELEEGSYQLYREGWFSGDFLLELNGKVVARASKPSVLRNRFEIELPDRQLVLSKPSSFDRRVIVWDGGKEIGSIYPLGAFTRRTHVDLPDDWPAIRAFLFWLVFNVWKRPNQIEVS